MPTWNPGVAVEVPGNGLDCNAATSDCQDLDGDGYNPASADCDHAQLDCNDANADVNPGKTEIPKNGIDDDCNPATPGACTPRPAEASVGAGAASTPGSVDLGLYLIPGAALALVLRRVRRMARPRS
ncbi:MAG: putative metal-binding motif-containing protein [bacterium]